MRRRDPAEQGCAGCADISRQLEKSHFSRGNAARPLHTLHRPVTTRLSGRSRPVLLIPRTRKERIS